MSNHDELQWLSAYLDGELRPAEAERVERHLPECVECRTELEALERTKALIAAAPRVEAPADLLDFLQSQANALAASAEDRKRSAGRSLWYMTGSLATAAALAVAVVSSLRPAPARFISADALLAAHRVYAASEARGRNDFAAVASESSSSHARP